MPYNRDNPSPRFQQLIGFYKQMHSEGDPAHDIPAEKMFDGRSLYAHIQGLRSMFKAFGTKTVLDYGSGKAGAYEKTQFKMPDGRIIVGLKDLWGVDHIHLYDPGYEPHSALPTGTFDAVICTDVMEHIPEEDLDWIIDELFGYANQMVYACIATYPAMKVFPDGTNVHVTLKHPDWWFNLFEARRKATAAKSEYLLVFDHGPNTKHEVRGSVVVKQ